MKTVILIVLIKYILLEQPLPVKLIIVAHAIICSITISFSVYVDKRDIFPPFLKITSSFYTFFQEQKKKIQSNRHLYLIILL